jgi:hypothetical protein
VFVANGVEFERDLSLRRPTTDHQTRAT